MPIATATPTSITTIVIDRFKEESSEGRRSLIILDDHVRVLETWNRDVPKPKRQNLVLHFENGDKFPFRIRRLRSPGECYAGPRAAGEGGVRE